MRLSNLGLIKFVFACSCAVLFSAVFVSWAASGQADLKSLPGIGAQAINSPTSAPRATPTNLIVDPTKTSVPKPTNPPTSIPSTRLPPSETPQTAPTATRAATSTQKPTDRPTATSKPDTATPKPDSPTPKPSTATTTPNTATPEPPPSSTPVKVPAPTNIPAQTPLPTLQPTVTSTATLITATLPAVTSTLVPTATSPVTQTNIMLGTPESAPPSTVTDITQAPAAPGLPVGMIIAHSTIAGPAGNWQVIVCVANLGTIKATGVVANASWPDEFRLLALRSRSGPVDYKNRLATARFGDMAPGTQVQVALLLSPGDITSVVPAIQAQLSYRDGPPLAPDKTVRCTPDGLQAIADNSSSVQRGVPVGTPIIEAPKVEHALVAVITPPAASETLAEPVMEQLATASWLCLGIPLLLVFVVFATLTYKITNKIRKRASRYQSATS